MRITILAVGRIRPGAERIWLDDYLMRARAIGRGIGVRAIEEIGIETRPATPLREAEAILDRLPPGGLLIGLDERGENLTSRHFAEILRPGGSCDDLAFVIGGAYGHAPALRARFSRQIAFGSATWPHRLARIMLAEQIYRGLGILAGTPYHREGPIS